LNGENIIFLMNIPNKLTVTRLILAPVIFIWFFSIDVIRGLSPVVYSIVLIVLLGVSELTDLLDGKIARKYNLVTDLGKVMDPFGDVICHLTYFSLFLVSGFMPVACFVVILWREFSQSFMRMLLMGKGKPMAANIFGKAKTCLYAFCSLCGFAGKIMSVFNILPNWFGITMTVLFIMAAVSSVVSFLIYIDGTVKSGVLKSLTR